MNIFACLDHRDVTLAKSDPSIVFYCTDNFYVEVLLFPFNLLYLGNPKYNMNEIRLTVQETHGFCVAGLSPGGYTICILIRLINSNEKKYIFLI